MKILIAVPNTYIGGITTAAVNLANELALRNNEVFFLDMSGNVLCTDRFNKNVRFVFFKGKSKLWNTSFTTL